MNKEIIDKDSIKKYVKKSQKKGRFIEWIIFALCLIDVIRTFYFLAVNPSAIAGNNTACTVVAAIILGAFLYKDGLKHKKIILSLNERISLLESKLSLQEENSSKESAVVSKEE